MSMLPQEQTKMFEGWRGRRYLDTKGVPTIGWGFNMQDKLVKSLLPKDVLSGRRELKKEEAQPIFDKLYKRAEDTARKYVGESFDNIPSTARNVVVDMAYNMGGKLNEFEKMKKALLAGDYQGMGFEMRNSDWFKQVGNRSEKHYTDIVSMEDYS